MNVGSGVRKDNTNLHLHQLFVGSEGQLGIITGVTMTVVPRPSSIQVAILGLVFILPFLNIVEIEKSLVQAFFSLEKNF